MPRNHGASGKKINLPGLLPWQVYFLAFVLGVFAVRSFFPATVALVCLYATDCLLRSRRVVLSLLLIAAVCGFAFGITSLPPEAKVPPAWMMERSKVEVRGVVLEVLPKLSDRIKIILGDVQCRLPKGDADVLKGKLVWTWEHPRFIPEPGQSVCVELRPRPVRGFRNAGTWDYAWFWRLRGVYWQAWTRGDKVTPLWGDAPRTFSWQIRDGIGTLIQKGVSKTQGGALVHALLTGDRRFLQVQTIKALRGAGLSHTLALSGLHVGFMAGIGFGLAFFVSWLFPRVLLHVPRPHLGVLFAAPFVLFYVWLGQPSASLFRAGIMFVFWGVLLLRGRGRVLLDGLFAALAVLVLLNPLSIFDLSLQMSALAVLGIGVLYPLLRPLFFRKAKGLLQVAHFLWSLFCVSFCANLALLPLLAQYFGMLAVNPLMNFFWIPLLGFLLMPLGVFGFLASLLIGWTEPLLWASFIADFMLDTLHLAEDAGFVPMVAVLRPFWPEMFGFVTLLLAAILTWRQSLRPISLLPLLILGSLLLVGPHWWVVYEDSREHVKLMAIDVGQGQAVVLSLPGGRRYLLDGGGTASRTFDIGEAVVGPVLTTGRAPRLEGVFLSHSDYDHAQGLCHILEHFTVYSFYANYPLPTGKVGKRMKRALQGAKLLPQAMYSGEHVLLSNGFSFACINPDRGGAPKRIDNDHSQMVLLKHGEQGLALICGDVGAKILQKVVAQGVSASADALVVPHHGSADSLNRSFYKYVQPRVALCSCGFLNHYGFPSQKVVHGLTAQGTQFRSTSEHGALTVTWRAGAGTYQLQP